MLGLCLILTSLRPARADGDHEIITVEKIDIQKPATLMELLNRRRVGRNRSRSGRRATCLSIAESDATNAVGALRGQEYAQAIQRQAEYEPASPFNAGSPEKAPAFVRDSVRDMFAPLVLVYGAGNLIQARTSRPMRVKTMLKTQFQGLPKNVGGEP
jgi:hypothetical protein